MQSVTSKRKKKKKPIWVEPSSLLINPEVAYDLYKTILRQVASQWSVICGDTSLEQAIRSWNVPLMISGADSLVSLVHETAAKHYAASQLAALIRKYPFSEEESGLDPAAAAREEFYSSELRCQQTNFKFRLCEVREDPRIVKMRNFIRYAIGDEPNESWMDRCDYTAGAALGVHGEATHLAAKLLVESVSCTPSALPYFIAAVNRNLTYNERFCARRGAMRCVQATPGGVLEQTRLVSYNKLGYVPKTAKTHRSVAVEPLGNSFLQKGLDLYMRDLLVRIGSDLSDQGINCELAHLGAIHGGHATIDLSSASDSISIGLCRAVLPPAWFSLLNCVRSPSYIQEDDDQPQRYEKFVTMGNGFCFPLQTLLYVSMVKAITPSLENAKDFVVYGDDIIVPTDTVPGLLDLLSFCGFIPNSRKTHTDGPFRESCGSNWYKEADVTPMTLDYALDTVQNMYKFVNLSKRNSRCSEFLLNARRLVVAKIPQKFLYWRPFKGAPDTGLDADLEIEACARSAFTRKNWVYRWTELQTTPVKEKRRTPQWVVIAGLLRNGTDQFFLRRQTRTRLVDARGSSNAPTGKPSTRLASIYRCIPSLL